MPSYTYRCLECSHTETVRNVSSDRRNEKVECPECHELAFERDVAATLEASVSGVALHEDVNSMIERKFGHVQGWQPPRAGNSEGRGSPGVRRYHPGDPRSSRTWV